MKVTTENEIDLENFDAWSGGKDRLDELIKVGTVKKVQQRIEEMFPDGIDETVLNDYLWFDAEQDMPECFDDNYDEKEEIRQKIDDMASRKNEATGMPIYWLESWTGTLYQLGYEEDEDDLREFKLVAEAEVHSNAFSGLMPTYEIDYDFSKSFEDNVEALKNKMIEEGEYPALGLDDMEYVEDFPTWAITYVAYNDSSGLSDEDKKLVDDWMEENDYAWLSDAIELTHTDFNKHPAFGLACETETVIMSKRKKEDSNA